MAQAGEGCDREDATERPAQLAADQSEAQPVGGEEAVEEGKGESRQEDGQVFPRRHRTAQRPPIPRAGGFGGPAGLAGTPGLVGDETAGFGAVGPWGLVPTLEEGGAGLAPGVGHPCLVEGAGLDWAGFFPMIPLCDDIAAAIRFFRRTKKTPRAPRIKTKNSHQGRGKSV
jgi:hypothetical protein